MYVICVCYLALKQKIPARPVRGELHCGPHHNSLICLVLCSEKKQIRPSFPVLLYRHAVEWANASVLFIYDGDDAVGTLSSK
jgi:hypothetical protein